LTLSHAVYSYSSDAIALVQNLCANSFEVLPPNAFKKNVNDKTLLNGLTVAGKTV
jgi:hypothetical protein